MSTQLGLFGSSTIDSGANVGTTSTVRVATWNVNSIVIRRQAVEEWLRTADCDVLCLQEIKVDEDRFPFELFLRHGYRAAVVGAKGTNGVAILSRLGLSSIDRGWDEADARYVSADVGEFRIASVYAPNAAAVGDPSFERKLAWFTRLIEHLDTNHEASDPLVLCGDFNVAPGELDAAPGVGPTQLATLVDPRARSAMRDLTRWGLSDVFRRHHAAGGLYTWWGYANDAYPRNFGMRIDLVLASAGLASRCSNTRIDEEPRRAERPSDHTPMLASFSRRD